MATVVLQHAEVRQGRTQLFRMWYDSQDGKSLFSFTAPLPIDSGMAVYEFLMAYDRGDHATRPRPNTKKK